MAGQTGIVYDDLEKSVDALIAKVGKEIKFGMPLALGKPSRFINALYQRAKKDSTIKLTIMTALALEKPTPGSELERRMLEPLVARVFEGTPDFDYMLDFRAGKLPSNVDILEFFFKAGGYMGNAVAQQNHMASNYTHVIRDATDYGYNVFGQMVASREENGKQILSMGCNTDICVEGVDQLAKQRANGGKVAIIAEINENLPFMYGDAVIDPDVYDIVIDNPDCTYPLFGPPKDSVVLKDHMIGLNVSTLIKDGGTIQVGIGALGDGIVSGLDLRQTENGVYNEVVKKAGILDRYKGLIEKIGGLDTFDQGLYGSSEMFVDAFMQMYKSGILKRKVFESVPLMKLINENKLSADKIPSDIFDLLFEKKAIHKKLKKKDFEFLTEFGILKEGLTFEDGFVVNGSGKYSADLRDDNNLNEFKKLIGTELKKGTVILGAFFLGPKAFYQALNEMSEEERQQFGMSGVEKVNQLYGGEELRALQRKDGRFVNAGMMVNLLGAITSDQLEDGRVISGIGGQYNFVSMAHALPDGRLVMMIRSTRGAGKSLASNVVFNYGHCSVTKHLRDIVVTEYGIADIRGKSDKDTIKAILNVADSRFQEGLLEQVKQSGKVPMDYEIPAEYKNNFPEKYESLLKPYQEKGYFKVFPFGTDIMDDEVVIGGSLKAFKAKAADSKLFAVKGLLGEFTKSIPDAAVPYLKRMELDTTSSLKEKIMQKVVLFALRSNNKI